MKGPSPRPLPVVEEGDTIHSSLILTHTVAVA